MNFNTVRSRLILIAVMVAISLVVIGGLSISGMDKEAKFIEQLYRRDMAVSNAANEVTNLLGNARSSLLLAFQHEPGGKFSAMHDHPVRRHLDDIRAKLRQSIRIINDDILTADLTAQNKALLGSLSSKIMNMKQQGFDVALQELERDNYNQANLTLLQVINPQFSQVTQIANDFLEGKLTEIEKEFIATEEEISAFIFKLILVVVIVGIVICVVIALISKRINLALENIQEVAEEVAKGNLTKQVNLSGEDELADLSRDVDKIVANFQQVVSNMNDKSIQLASTAEQSSAVAMQTKQNIVEQQQQTQLIATAINEFTTTVQGVADNASSAAEASEGAESATSEGKTVVQDTIALIAALNNEITDTTGIISQLSEKSNQIGTVVDVIDGISEQTNLLALNAAIEAARAGEAGRGFAVVADEVRSLASRTQDSTVEIKAMIGALQESSNDSLSRMEKGAQQAKSTVEMAEKAGLALDTILSSVAKISELNIQIATSAEQQSVVTNEINKNVNSINDISLQTADGAEQNTASSIELAQLTEEMKEQVSKFEFA